MYCQKCGSQVLDEAVICPLCGCAIRKAPTVEDKVSVGLLLLSIAFPIAGWVLWGVKRQETPDAANAYGIAGLVAWVFYLFLI